MQNWIINMLVILGPYMYLLFRRFTGSRIKQQTLESQNNAPDDNACLTVKRVSEQRFPFEYQIEQEAQTKQIYVFKTKKSPEDQTIPHQEEPLQLPLHIPSLQIESPAESDHKQPPLVFISENRKLSSTRPDEKILDTARPLDSTRHQEKPVVAKTQQQISSARLLICENVIVWFSMAVFSQAVVSRVYLSYNDDDEIRVLGLMSLVDAGIQLIYYNAYNSLMNRSKLSRSIYNGGVISYNALMTLPIYWGFTGTDYDPLCWLVACFFGIPMQLTILRGQK